MKPPVLVTRKIQERPLNLLQEQAQVTIHLENRPMTPDEIIAQLPGKVGLLAAGGDPLSANLLEAGGSVNYQVHEHWTDRRRFPRWSMAPMAFRPLRLASTTPRGIRPSKSA